MSTEAQVVRRILVLNMPFIILGDLDKRPHPSQFAYISLSSLSYHISYISLSVYGSNKCYISESGFGC